MYWSQNGQSEAIIKLKILKIKAGKATDNELTDNKVSSPIIKHLIIGTGLTRNGKKTK